MASAIVLPDFIADSVSKTYTRPNSRGRYRGRSETLIRSSSGVLNRCFTVTFSLSHQPSLTYKQTPPPLDLSKLQFRSDLHGIPKPGNETQSYILSVCQVSVRVNRQEFFKSRELLHIASNSQKLVLILLI